METGERVPLSGYFFPSGSAVTLFRSDLGQVGSAHLYFNLWTSGDMETALCPTSPALLLGKSDEAGRTVIAYGDSLGDYYMLKQADHGYLVTKSDRSVSRSLKGKDLGGIEFV